MYVYVNVYIRLHTYIKGTADLKVQGREFNLQGKTYEEENGNPRQYSCLGNPMDRGAWQPTAHGVAKSGT